MKLFDIRTVFAVAAAALLTGCGADVATYPAAQSSPAALAVQVNAPVADCEAEGCKRPRIVDGLAEQYRASAIAQPAEPAPAAESAPSEAASGAAALPQ